MKISYANVTSTLALVFALGGTSYAAITITSKNVKNNSLTSADIRNGTLTASDVKKGSLTAGLFRSGQLPAGAKGDKGDPGAKGDQGIQGIQGDKGDTGPAGPFPTGNLPSGVTLRGAFRTGAQVSAGGISQTSVSFLYRLSADPTPHFIPEDGTPPEECPGTVAAPEAAPGHLCLYESFHATTVGTSQTINNPVNNTSGQASRYGFGYSIQANGNGNFSSVGTWAVTAP